MPRTTIALVFALLCGLLTAGCHSVFTGYRGPTELPQDVLLMAPEDTDWAPPALVGDIERAGVDTPEPTPSLAPIYPPGRRWHYVWIYPHINAAGDVVHGHYVSVVIDEPDALKHDATTMPLQPLEYKEDAKTPAARLVPSVPPGMSPRVPIGQTQPRAVPGRRSP